MIITESARLVLRQFHIGDLEALAAIFADEAGAPWGEGARSRRWTEAWLLGCFDNYYRQWGFGQWAAVGRGDGKLIGFCGLGVLDDVRGRREIELGYRLARAWWGQGLATEAAAAVLAHSFAEMGLERVISLIDPRNAASCRIAEKIGMRTEGEVELDGPPAVRLYAAQRHGG